MICGILGIILVLIGVLLLIIKKKIYDIHTHEKDKQIICSSCGAEILDKTGEFCSKCGSPIK